MDITESNDEKSPKKRVLPQNEENLIKNNEMLTDVSINIAQNILRRQFQHAPGLQDPVLGQKLMFKTQEKFVQILHTNNFHWVMATNINCDDDTVDLYDSWFHAKVKDHIKLQICNIYKSKSFELKINVRSCQQQTNGLDCGIYSVINAYYLLSGIDISNLRIDETNIRELFLNCMNREKFEHFPESGKDAKTIFSPEKVIIVETFCLCKMPWVWYHSKNPELVMAECDSCRTWYHKKCENIPIDVFQTQSEWCCFNCKNA